MGKAMSEDGGRKHATSTTAAHNRAIRDALPFADATDFEDAQRGAASTPPI
jgi:alkyl sulfatase BDS1-like metallo-beta-lactamase superfamily hydrolase